MKNRIWSILLCTMLLFSMLPSTALADIGPKPSVEIQFTGAEEGVTYYATLLSYHESTGPASAWDGNPLSSQEADAIWKAFVDYEDSDGYYFLQEYWNCTGKDRFRWGYYPPTPFKVLCYFPETDTYAVSGIYERYAFDTYYTVDLSAMKEAGSAGGEGQQVPVLQAKKNYDYTWELISLAARIVITILLEMGLALLFGYRHKKQLRFLAVVNIITQIILNVLLNVFNYRNGHWSFVFFYVLLELLVILMEAILYALVLPKMSRTITKATIEAAEPGKKVSVPKTIQKRHAILYAAIANVASFAIGLLIARLIPGIF
ncbi:MAG: hypothetical protein J6I64_09275 [Lachnospiraceae bacterium]|nr:hypothetical protein [Lachnospiraceae bacterium]